MSGRIPNVAAHSDATVDGLGIGLDTSINASSSSSVCAHSRSFMRSSGRILPHRSSSTASRMFRCVELRGSRRSPAASALPSGLAGPFPVPALRIASRAASAKSVGVMANGGDASVSFVSFVSPHVMAGYRRATPAPVGVFIGTGGGVNGDEFAAAFAGAAPSRRSSSLRS